MRIVLLVTAFLWLLAGCGENGPEENEAEAPQENNSEEETNETAENNTEEETNGPEDNNTENETEGNNTENEAEEPEENNAGETEENHTEEEESMEEELAFQTEASLASGMMTVQMRLVNNTEETKELTFRSGQRYNVVIHDSSGTKQFDFAEGMMFTQAIEEKQLEGGEELSYELEWETEGEAPYEVTTEITVSEIDGEEAGSLQETVTVE